MTEDTKNKQADLKKLVLFLYAINALSILTQYSMTVALVGGIGLIVSVIIAYMKRDAVKGTYLESHIRWIIRTFWIGGSVILPVITILAFILMSLFLDYSMVTPEIAQNPEMMMDFMYANNTRITAIILVTLVPASAWWLYRCWAGWLKLKKEQPIENVTSWI